MKKILDLIILFFRRNISAGLIFSLAIPIFMIAINMFSGRGGNIPKTIVLNLDKGEYAAEFIEDYSEKKSIEIVDTIEDGEKLIKEQIKDNLYIFSENYSETIEKGDVPELQRKTRDQSIHDDQGFITYLNNQVHNAVSQNLAANSGVYYVPLDTKLEMKEVGHNITGEQQMLIITMGFSILYGSAFFAKDLVELRKSKVLRRGLTTPTSGVTVLASKIAGAWLLQFISFLICLVIVSFVITMSSHFLTIFIIMLAMSCLFSVCLQLLFLRVFKDPDFTSFVGMMSAIVFMFLAMLKDLEEVLSAIPSFVYNLSYLSPFYWVMEAIEGRPLIISVGMMLLLSAVLFFAGSFRLKDFAD